MVYEILESCETRDILESCEIRGVYDILENSMLYLALKGSNARRLSLAGAR